MADRVPPAEVPWHALSVEEVLRRLDSSPAGLSASDAYARLQRFGPNALPARGGTTIWQLVLRQIASPLIYILLIAALISLLIGDPEDSYVILAVVLLNTLLGVTQEYRAERALAALRELTAPRARVLRDGREEEIPATEVVPGDLLLLRAGDRVPADARVIATRGLRVDESTLTGESVPVDKTTEPLPVDLPPPDRTNVVYTGTVVTYGHGRAVTFATGTASQLGRIAAQISAEPVSETPLQRRLGVFGTRLGWVALALAALLFAIGLLRQLPVRELVFVATAAAVSFVPEGLPAVLTVVLAVGVQRMARRNALIRRLPAVETLGSATVICSDKTGTLTRNEMVACALEVAGRRYRVTGVGHDPRGEFCLDGECIDPAECHPLRLLLLAGVLASEAQIVVTDGERRLVGDPTEVALLVAAQKGGIHLPEENHIRPILDEIPFSSEQGYMASLRREPDGGHRVYLKGAPERVLAMCHAQLREDGVRPLTEAARRHLTERLEAMAADGLRVLAVAYRDVPPEETALRRESLERLVLLGLVGLLDPPRPEAIEAIERARAAGIRSVMITGDHVATARAIARQMGILRPGDEVIDGRTLATLSDAELEARAPRIAVYARVQPEHKLRIVRALQRRGEIVAMTGDGVNDAPALRQADIGIAMGITGTEVAKGASDMVLADDNFATIVNAIEAGRNLYENIRRVVLYLLATNTGEILTHVTGLTFGWPLVLLPVQILWVNLVTDGLNTVAMAMEQGDPDVLRQPPRPPNAPVVDGRMVRRIVFVATFMTIGTLALFWGTWEGASGRVVRARSMAFCSLAFFQLWNVLNVRSGERSIFAVGWFTNPWLNVSLPAAAALQWAAVSTPFFQRWFDTTSLTAGEWLLILAVTSTVWIADEIRKGLVRAGVARGLAPRGLRRRPALR